MFKQLRKVESGIVLVTVLVMILVMTIFALSILSINVTEVSKIEDLSDSLVAKALAEKYYWWAYYNVLSGNNFTELIQNRTYTINISWTAPPPPQNVIINVVY